MLNLRQFYHLEYSFNVLIPSSHIQCDSAWRLWRLCSSSPTVLTLGSSFLLMFSFWLTSFLLSMFQTWWAWDVFIPPHQPLSCILNLVVQQVPQRQLIDTHEPCVPPPPMLSPSTQELRSLPGTGALLFLSTVMIIQPYELGSNPVFSSPTVTVLGLTLHVGHNLLLGLPAFCLASLESAFSSSPDPSFWSTFQMQWLCCLPSFCDSTEAHGKEVCCSQQTEQS